ncbi:MAG: rhodanese-like domain-containing protein [Poseidonibacter sp.]|uniref:rhodanese-like domain-containing protein n=1 Tax=Poseidonibacter sp. TaxID=2321188 RepID=UPI00359E4C9A
MQDNINFMILSRQLDDLLKSNANIVIIDVRTFEEYKQGHIPKAINIPEIFTYLPEGITTIIEKESFVEFYEKIFSEAGISKDEIVVFYEDKFTLKSPRGLTILKYLGYDEEKIKVLDSGYYGWLNQKYKISTKIIHNTPKIFKANVQEDFFLDYNEMLEALDNTNIIKLDVRDKDEWVGISSSPYGIDYAPKKGRLPNAVWIQWYDFITENMLSVKSLEKIQYELDKNDIKPNDNIVLYCFKGARLSNSYIALRRLGYKNIRIYFAGWNEWCRKENAPIINEVENNNNPLLQENIALKKKLDKLNLEKTNLIDFPKYNKEPIFAFDREGFVCSQNEPKKLKLPSILKFTDIFKNASKIEIYNIIDNNQNRDITYKEGDSYYSLHIIGSRDANKILVYGFDTTKIYKLNNTLDKKNQELKNSQETFKLLFDIAPILIDSFDKNGKCILWNNECEKVFGWTKEELNNHSNSFELFYPDPNIQKAVIDTILVQEKGVFKQWHPLNKKGEVLTTMWTHIDLPDGEIINIGYDITKLKDDQKKLAEQSKLVAMGEMIANIAHQWRQPLSVISTAATGLKITKENNLLTDDYLFDMCTLIDEKAQYLSKTIEEFGDFVKGNIKIEKFTMKFCIESFLKILEERITINNINVVYYIEDDIKIESYLNELTQCFINILNNSIDVLVEKNNINNRYVFINQKVENNKIIIIFKDNGNGICESIKSKIFEPYFTTKHKSQGTGLGLNLTHNLVKEIFNGSIEVNNVDFEHESKKYQGAEFKLIIPIK